MDQEVIGGPVQDTDGRSYPKCRCRSDQHWPGARGICAAKFFQNNMPDVRFFQLAAKLNF